jgi:hypothetical protein
MIAVTKENQRATKIFIYHYCIVIMRLSFSTSFESRGATPCMVLTNNSAKISLRKQ